MSKSLIKKTLHKRLNPIIFLTCVSLFSDIYASIATGQYLKAGITLNSFSGIYSSLPKIATDIQNVMFLTCSATSFGGVTSVIALCLFFFFFRKKALPWLGKEFLILNIVLAALPHISFIGTLIPAVADIISRQGGVFIW